jgi:16S rRNA processing protein RimM
MSSTSSKTEARQESRSDLPETVAVGRVLRAHGVQGEVVVLVLSDVPDRVAPGRRLLLTREGTRKGEPARTVTVESARPHKSGLLVRLEGVGDRDRADELRGAWLEVLRSEVPEPPAGTYYHFQLVGCRCFDNGQDLGEVVELLEDGGGLLLIVADGERRLPVPFVERFLKGVDVAAGRIDLELPPGLIEACASRS